LREKLIKQGIAPEKLTVRHLTYEEVTRQMASEEMEWHRTENRANFEKALAQPRGQAEVQRSKDANAFRRFATGAGWSPVDHAQLVENMKRIKREFPAVVSNKANSDAIAEWLLDQKCYPTYPNMRLAVTTLASAGAVTLNPSAVGIPEDRYGDFIEGKYQISRVSAADLRLMTEPYRQQSEHDEIRAMTADQFYKSEHGRALREERNKHADPAIREKELRQAEAAVEFFLTANRDYARTDDNRDQILRWLKDRNLPMTQNSLQQAFATRPFARPQRRVRGKPRGRLLRPRPYQLHAHATAKTARRAGRAKVRQENHDGGCAENVLRRIRTRPEGFRPGSAARSPAR